MADLSRRGFLSGLAAAIAAPAVARAIPATPALAGNACYWMGTEGFFILSPSMFADLMSDPTPIKGINRGEIGWWQGITFTDEQHDPRQVVQHQGGRIRPRVPRAHRAIPFRRDASI